MTEERVENIGISIMLVGLGLIIGLLSYGIVGTEGRVPEIKERALKDISQRGWEVIRYESYDRGSFYNHGGKVWYHVRDKDDHGIKYRVYITLWGGELHYHYGKPESIDRVRVNLTKEGKE